MLPKTPTPSLTRDGVADQCLDETFDVVALGLDGHLDAELARRLRGHRADGDHPSRAREAVADRLRPGCGRSTTR